MQRHFKCGECGASFDYPVIRFDNGLKVCPACLHFVTNDALNLFLKRIKYFRKLALKSDNPEELFNTLFPIDTKIIFKDDTEED